MLGRVTLRRCSRAGGRRSQGSAFTIARERLVTTAIGEEAAQVVVCAPAGAGKTTLLSQLAIRLRDRSDAICWLRLSAEDNDARHLLRGSSAPWVRAYTELEATRPTTSSAWMSRPTRSMPVS